MQSGLLLNVVVGEGPTVLELLASEDQPLLIWGNSFLVLDLGLNILDGVRGFHLQSDRLASQGLNEDLHSTSETQDQMQSGLLLNVVVGEGPAVLELLASKDQPLLVWGNSLLVLNLGLDILDGIRGLHLKGDGL